MKSIILGEVDRCFNTLEYLEISDCDKLIMMAFGNIWGSMYINVKLENLPSLTNILWTGPCFSGNKECRRWKESENTNKKGKGNTSSETIQAPPEFSNIIGRRIEPNIRHSTDTRQKGKGRSNSEFTLPIPGCMIHRNTLIMNSRIEKMYLV